MLWWRVNGSSCFFLFRCACFYLAFWFVFYHIFQLVTYRVLVYASFRSINLHFFFSILSSLLLSSLFSHLSSFVFLFSFLFSSIFPCLFPFHFLLFLPLVFLFPRTYLSCPTVILLFLDLSILESFVIYRIALFNLSPYLLCYLFCYLIAYHGVCCYVSCCAPLSLLASPVRVGELYSAWLP